MHVAEVTDGELIRGQGAVLVVDHARRSAIRANHSATHLLNEALRESLGDARRPARLAERCRPAALRLRAWEGGDAEELAAVERTVNDFIRQNSAVETRIMTPDEARAIGAQALFGEKYGDEVRVVSMGRKATGKGGDGQTWSIELCGGTHVARTGEIGLCVVLGDSASSAGVRRIEALTGAAALDSSGRRGAATGRGRERLKAPVAEVPGPGAGADRRTPGAAERGRAAAPGSGDGGAVDRRSARPRR